MAALADRLLEELPVLEGIGAVLEAVGDVNPVLGIVAVVAIDEGPHRRLPLPELAPALVAGAAVSVTLLRLVTHAGNPNKCASDV